MGPEDAARLYEGWQDKGPVAGGQRLTLLAPRVAGRVGEPVEVLHVYEITEPGRELHVMGPKPVFGETLDGAPASAPPPDDDDPLHPGLYDGRVLASPGIDANFETDHLHVLRARPARADLERQRADLEPAGDRGRLSAARGPPPRAVGAR